MNDLKMRIISVFLLSLSFILLFLVYGDLTNIGLELWHYTAIYLALFMFLTITVLHDVWRKIAIKQGWSFIGTLIGSVSLIYGIYLQQMSSQLPQPSEVGLSVIGIIIFAITILGASVYWLAKKPI